MELLRGDREAVVLCDVSSVCGAGMRRGSDIANPAVRVRRLRWSARRGARCRARRGHRRRRAGFAVMTSSAGARQLALVGDAALSSLRRIASRALIDAGAQGRVGAVLVKRSCAWALASSRSTTAARVPLHGTLEARGILATGGVALVVEHGQQLVARGRELVPGCHGPVDLVWGGALRQSLPFMISSSCISLSAVRAGSTWEGSVAQGRCTLSTRPVSTTGSCAISFSSS